MDDPGLWVGAALITYLTSAVILLLGSLAYLTDRLIQLHHTIRRTRTEK